MSGAVPSLRRGGHSARVVLQARDGLRSACRRGEREVVAIGRRRCRPTVARTLPVSGVLTYWIDQGPVARVTPLDVPARVLLNPHGSSVVRGKVRHRAGGLALGRGAQDAELVAF